MHIHHGEEEAFYVPGGELTYGVGDQTFPAPPGTLAYLPRNVPHGFVCHTETGAGALRGQPRRREERVS